MMDCLYAKCEGNHNYLKKTVHVIVSLTFENTSPSSKALFVAISEYYNHVFDTTKTLYLTVDKYICYNICPFHDMYMTVHVGVPCITDCVVGELEKLGSKFRVAQQIAKDPRFERLPCMHKGTYADDCLINRVTQVSTIICYSL